MDLYALGQIHDRYYPEVYRYVRFRLQDEAVCEEIASEVFLRLLNALQKKRIPDRDLPGWLIKTAAARIDHRRVALQRHPKEHSVDGSTEGAAQALVAAGPAEDHLEAVRRKIRRALSRLATEQQHVLAVRFAEGRSLEETTRIIGKAEGAVKDLQVRALASLRSLLQEEK